MIKVRFKYRDEYSYPNWNEQECVVNTLQECIEFYGLNECEYQIIEIKEV